MTQETDQPFFELRQYIINDGQLDRWVAYMDETIIPFQRSCGMVVIGSWHVQTASQYVWIRRFESEADRQRLYATVYESDFWKNEALAVVEEMLDRQNGVTVTRMVASPLSIVR